MSYLVAIYKEHIRGTPWEVALLAIPLAVAVLNAIIWFFIGQGITSAVVRGWKGAEAAQEELQDELADVGGGGGGSTGPPDEDDEGAADEEGQ